ncbi:MAG: transcription-repair coupling factor [Planctomycetes bacterium]|nr:transcription-repair coupling factor [Planctomycetota bacterium]
MVISSIAADPLLGRLIERLASCPGVVHATGLWGSSAPLVAASAARQLARTFLYVTAHLEEADNARDDLELFLQAPSLLFPAWETLPGEGAASGEIQAERLRLCTQLRRQRAAPKGGGDGQVPGTAPRLIVAPIQALMQPVPRPALLEAHTLHLQVGGAGQRPTLSPEALVAWAVDRGFARLDMVEAPGDVARRGDIVDLFLPGETHPYRVQFFGDEVESLRRFDISTQRSMESLPALAVSALPVDAPVGDAPGTDLFAYLPSDTVVVLDQPAEVQELGETLAARLGVSERLFAVTDVLAAAARLTQLHLGRFAAAATRDESVFDFAVASVSRFEGGAGEVLAELLRAAREHHVHVFCDNEGERQRLREMLREHSAAGAGAVNLELGVMHRGFEWTRTRSVVVGHHELFHRQRQRRRIRKLHAGRPLESWMDLKPGDLVVHVVHGIAVFRGLKTLRKGDSAQVEEFLTLEFAEGAVVHVPVSQVDLVQQYIGAAGRRPQLSTLGGKRWARTKQQVADSVAELAESLLRVQAIRHQAEGVAYPPDTQWQREFEAAFLYEETEDQLLVAEEIRADLTRARSMDRVVCGDVGYGKTELAMRAAFKVVEFGKQVAVLVPTTVLAEQHYQTFRERMADYPFVVGCLSRFRTATEQKAIVDKARRGQIDIVIGTHRLLSKDVSFADLGLVIIDEEQRFGVEHKERLKSLRETVDVLTLTATPIPRTLHMSLMGIRDISSLHTPPVDRRAIATYVRPFERSLIRDTVLRELNRDGQVFFVHNYVQSIAAMADTLRGIVPEARVVHGHGQMPGGALEEVMHRFVRREADVLVCTTIIESGIDIPSANTIFIDRADRFGLADLHQLRGRVGRSSHRAYCYLLLSPGQTVTSKAAKRLKTIEEFSELGAGFRIAMRDLEIRGAGNLLGKEQSGDIAAVGYEMYCRLLDQTIRRLKNEPDPTPPAVHVDLDVAAHIPANYISADRSRIEVYRRVVSCRTPEELEQLLRDLTDAFGPIPKPLERLLELAEIRVHARRFGIVSISLRPPDVVFIVDNLPQAEPLFAGAAGSVRMPDPRTVHWRVPANYLETPTLLAVLRRLFSRALSGSPATVA